MPVILATDALVFLLIALGLVFGYIARGKEHLREPWSRIARSPVGMGALVVLGAFVVIGILDSIHYHPRLPASEENSTSAYSNEILSLFDNLVTPLRQRQEKTYSAPFATHLYAKENIELPDGGSPGTTRVCNTAAATSSTRSASACPISFVPACWVPSRVCCLWLMLAGLLIVLIARRAGQRFGAQLRRVASGDTEVPWRVILLTLGVMILLVFVSARLGVKYHLLGTDKVGEDVFYQALKSIRTGSVIGTLTTLVMLPAAILLGIMAGYFRGWVDDVIQYLYTTLNSIPGVLLIAAAILMLHIYMGNHAEDFNSLAERADLRLLFLVLILGVTSWTGLCRLLRGETLKLREMDYVQAAQAFGVTRFTIITRHILPNVLHIVLITVVLDFSGLVLAEAVLSYVNIGVDPTMNSWGNMINSARLEMAREPIVWWSLAASFVFMFTLVLSANLFSDVVRDAFDPRLRDTR